MFSMVIESFHSDSSPDVVGIPTSVVSFFVVAVVGSFNVVLSSAGKKNFNSFNKI